MPTTALEPRSHRLALPDLTLHYTDTGRGRPLLLLHGYTDSLHSFDLALPHLSPHARCIALDQRGHGLSACTGPDFSFDAFTRDAVRLIERLSLAPVAIAGHSMGSFIARKVALARPDLVDRLILIGSGTSTDTPAVRDLGAALAHLPDAIPPEFVREFQASCVRDVADLPPAFFRACVRHSAALPPRVWHGAFAGMAADDHTARLHDIECPTLVVAGVEDAVFPPNDQRRLARAIPNARLILYEAVGHTPHWERPARFASDVLEFLG